MAFEFEALVGHLYVVGGRTISSPPPGAYVEVAPRKAGRGRETDTFFALVLPADSTSTVAAAFYENMAEMAAEQYFESTGSVTAGIRTVFGLLNDQLYVHNQNDPHRYEASMLIAVMRGTDIYIGRVGEAAAVYRHQGVVQFFPDNFNTAAVFGPPLGAQSIPDVRMGMYSIAPGSRLLLGDSALTAIDISQITHSMAADDIGSSLVSLKSEVIGGAHMSLVEFVLPETPLSLPVREGESLKAVTAARTAKAETPTAPPAPQGSEAPRPARSSTRSDPMERAAGRVAVGAANTVQEVNRTLDRVLPEAPAGKRGWLNSPAAAVLAVLLPVLVVIGVVAIWVNGTGESEFDQCVGEAVRAADVARGIASTDVAGTVAAWNAVLLVGDRCETLRAGDPQIGALKREGRVITDQLSSVQRRGLDVLATMPSAMLTEGVLQGEDLYVLDNANDLVYRVRISTEGMTLAAGSRPEAIPAMRRAGIVNQFTVGDLTDIAWADDGGGLSQGSVIVALDANGVLIDCPPSFLQLCRAQQLNTETWTNPIAIQFWQGNLYVLDASANQIWRYAPSGGAFPNAPTEYFTGEGRPNISGAVDFAIDTPGNVYVLLENGVFARFTGGDQEGFQFANFPASQRMTRANAFNLIPSPPRQGIYFADGTSRTIFETTMAGTFVAAYRGQNDLQLADLGDIAVDTNKQIVYALAGDAVYAFTRQGSP